MMYYVISGLLFLFGLMVGYAQRSESDKMRIRHMRDENHDQLLTIRKHEVTIQRLKSLAEERAKTS